MTRACWARRQRIRMKAYSYSAKCRAVFGRKGEKEGTSFRQGKNVENSWAAFVRNVMLLL